MSGRLNPILAALTALLLGAAVYMAFFYAPTERTMGEIQRIFYFHAASGWTAGVAFFISLIGCLGYLATRNLFWDALAASAAEIGLMFMTVVLLTGPIWAKPVWGIWWTWDARLTSSLVCWLLYVAYILLRGFMPEAARKAVVSAVFGVFAFVDIPIVWMSIRWWRTQHPSSVLGEGGSSGLETHMWHALFMAWAALSALMVCYLVVRVPIEQGHHRLEVLRRRLGMEETL